ncbi:LuxR C-terminal-related transcriptional regulator [Nocardioides sp.]|uniref:helix-turn-helix transcriptional regulator n=1 Tax=Nocardioides sp. TaxID=35761 RepID=UPI00356A2729
MVPTALLTAACAQVRSGDLKEGMGRLLALRSDHEDKPDLLDHEAASVLLTTLVECRLARGELNEAIALGEELSAFLDHEGDDTRALAAALAHQARGDLAAALGDAELALKHYQHAGSLAPKASPEQLPWRCGAALAHLRTGDARAAAQLAAKQVQVAQESRSPYAMATALRTLAAVAIDTGPDRIQHLLRARAVLSGNRADRLGAQIDTDLAGLLLLTHANDAEQRALALLRSAEEHAGRQELWPLQGRIRRLLDRLGQQPRKIETEAMAALTASERRVARMAAEGMTNRQIATELVVTVKAVEWHLSHVYRKLGINSRTMLAETLGMSEQVA